MKLKTAVRGGLWVIGLSILAGSFIYEARAMIVISLLAGLLVLVTQGLVVFIDWIRAD